MNPFKGTNEKYTISYSDSYDKPLKSPLMSAKPRKKTNSSSNKKIDFKSKMKNFLKNFDELVDNLSNCSNDDSDKGYPSCKITKSNFSTKYSDEFPFTNKIDDFHKYTEECIKKIPQIKSPTLNQLEPMQVELERYNKSSNLYFI